MSGIQEARRAEEEELRREEEARQLLEAQHARFARLKEEAAKVGQFVPRLTQEKKLLYSVTKLTLDKTARDREIKVSCTSLHIFIILDRIKNSEREHLS
jgi:anti-sigma-K factor RskA